MHQDSIGEEKKSARHLVVVLRAGRKQSITFLLGALLGLICVIATQSNGDGKSLNYFTDI